MIEIDNLIKSYGQLDVIKGINMNVEKGEVISIIGASGSGKSTLLYCINALENIQGGRIIVDGIDAHARETDVNALRTKIGMVFQQFNVWPHLNVLENVIKAQVVVGKKNSEEAKIKAIKMLNEVGLKDKFDEWPDNLSGGQKQRLAIARSLAMDPILMLLDEPTSALDPELIGEVLTVLRNLVKEGMTMLIVTHELGFASNFADKIVFMDAGEIIETGTPREILKFPKTDRLKHFLDKLSITSF